MSPGNAGNNNITACAEIITVTINSNNIPNGSVLHFVAPDLVNIITIPAPFTGSTTNGNAVDHTLNLPQNNFNLTFEFIVECNDQLPPNFNMQCYYIHNGIINFATAATIACSNFNIAGNNNITYGIVPHTSLSLTINPSIPNLLPGQLSTRTYNLTFNSLNNAAFLNHFIINYVPEADIVLVNNTLTLSNGGNTLPVNIIGGIIEITPANLALLGFPNGMSPGNSITISENIRAVCSQQNAAPQTTITVDASCGNICSNILQQSLTVDVDVIQPDNNPIAVNNVQIIPAQVNNQNCVAGEYILSFNLSIAGGSNNNSQLHQISLTYDNNTVSDINLPNITLNGTPIQGSIANATATNINILNIPINNNPINGLHNTMYNGGANINNLNNVLWFGETLTVSVPITINSAYLQTCGNQFNLTTDIDVSIRSICGVLNNGDPHIDNINIPINNPITYNSNSTCLPYDLDFGNPNGGIAQFYYGFNFIGNTDIGPFDLMLGNTQVFTCQNVTYSLWLTLPELSIGANPIPQAVNGTFIPAGLQEIVINNLNLTLESENIVNGVTYQQFSFLLPNNITLAQLSNSQLYLNLNIPPGGIDCPFDNATFGVLNYSVELRATCNPCDEHYRSIACANNIINIHCPGNCAGTIPFTLSIDEFNINRISLGWANKNDFLTGAAPYNGNTLLNALQQMNPASAEFEYHIQTHSGYQDDLVEITAQGANLSTTLTNLRFEFYYQSYSNAGGIVTLSGAGGAAAALTLFEPIDAKMTITGPNGQVTEYNFDASSNANTLSYLFPYDKRNINGSEQWVRIQQFSITQPNPIPSGIIHFTGRFRVRGPSIVGNYPLASIRSQFRHNLTENNNNGNNFCCDPYGGAFNIYVIGHQYYTRILGSTTGAFTPQGIYNTFAPLGANTYGAASDCRYRIIHAFRITGGLGAGVNEFPFEYRPYLNIPEDLTQQGEQILCTYTFPDDYYNFLETNHMQNIWQTAGTSSINGPNETINITIPPNQRAFSKGEGNETNGIFDFMVAFRKRCITTQTPINFTFNIHRNAYAAASNNLLPNNLNYYNNNEFTINIQANHSHPDQPVSNPVAPANQTVYVPSAQSSNINILQSTIKFVSPDDILSASQTVSVPIHYQYSLPPSPLENFWVCYQLVDAAGTVIWPSQTANPNGPFIQSVTFNPGILQPTAITLNHFYYFNNGFATSGSNPLGGQVVINFNCNAQQPFNSCTLRITYGNYCTAPQTPPTNCAEATNGSCATAVIQKVIIHQTPTANLQALFTTSGINCFNLNFNLTVQNPSSFAFNSGHLIVQTPPGLFLQTANIPNNFIPYSVNTLVTNNNTITGYQFPDNTGNIFIAPSGSVTLTLQFILDCSLLPNIEETLNALFIGLDPCLNLVNSNLIAAVLNNNIANINNVCCIQQPVVTTSLNPTCNINGANIHLAVTPNGNTNFSFSLYNTNGVLINSINATGNNAVFADVEPGNYSVLVAFVSGTNALSYIIPNIQVVAMPVCPSALSFNDEAVSNIAALYPQFDNTLGVIRINGTFTIDQDFTFDAADIILGPGAVIDILPGNTLTIINQSHLHGCCEMWSMIHVQSPNANGDMATLFVDESLIEDGIHSIQAEDQSNVYLTTNTFNKNYVSLFLNNTSGVGGNSMADWIIAGNEFRCTPGQYLLGNTVFSIPSVNQLPFAGIQTIGFKTSIPEGNHFEKMRYGIHMLNSTIQIGPKNTFKQIRNNNIATQDGVAVFADVDDNTADHSLLIDGILYYNPAAYNFLNCRVGVETHHMNVTINRTIGRVLNRGFDIGEGAKTDIYVYDNLLEKVTIKGIILDNNDQVNSMIVERNNIEMTGTTNSVIGIHIVGSNLPPYTGPYKIFANNITIKSGQIGIYATTTKSLEIAENTVLVPDNMLFEKGISCVNNSSLKLSCNNVERSGLGATSVITTNPPLPLGIELKNTTGAGNIFSCNRTNNVYAGICFFGSNYSQFTANYIGNHSLGLFYSANAITGIQTNAGNKFSPIYGTTTGIYAAYHLGNNIIYNQSFYFVTNLTSTASLYNPKSVYVTNAGYSNLNNTLDDQDWFTEVGGTNAHCTSGTFCAEPQSIVSGGGDNNASNYDYSIAQNSLEYASYQSQEKWSNDKLLLQKLYQNPELLEDSVLLAYNNAMQQSSARLYGTTAFNLSTVSRLGAADSLNVLELNNNISDTDSLLQIQTTILYDSTSNIAQKTTARAAYYQLSNNINQSRSQISAIVLANRETNNTKYDSIRSVNATFVDTALYELNEKTVNEIFASTLAKMNYVFSPAQKALLYSISNQCPLAGGDAVYRARALFTIFDDTTDFDDAYLCYLANMQFREDEIVDTIDNDFLLVPNPTSNITTLYWKPSQLENTVVIVKDLMGRTVQQTSIDYKQGHAQIDLSTYSSGIYFISILNNNSVLFKSKIIKQ
jgi:hypothetical protein